MGSLPKRQRVGAYAVILRSYADDSGRRIEVLLSRLAPRVSASELWFLPGGGVDHGEDPRVAVLREVTEETGLVADVSEAARIYSAHMPRARRGGGPIDAHAIRIVYDGWVPPDAPAPGVVEIDGSTADAAWHPLEDVLAGKVPVAQFVAEALEHHRPLQRQRLAAYALVVRPAEAGDEMLLTHLSHRAVFPGMWTLPGGGIDHGERPAVALAREVQEECGLECTVGSLLDVHDTHFSGTAPTGRVEDFHGVHLVFEATVADGAPSVAEVDGTTDQAAWVPVADVLNGRVRVLELVMHALALSS